MKPPTGVPPVPPIELTRRPVGTTWLHRTSSRVRPLMNLAIPLTALPSALWRIAALAGAYGPAHPVTEAIRSEAVEVLLLSVGSVASLAALVSGMTVVERGRLARLRRPLRNAAYGLSALICAVTAYAILNSIFHWVGNLDPQGREFPLVGNQLLIVQACYAPLLTTGPLLALRTFVFAASGNGVRSA